MNAPNEFNIICNESKIYIVQELKEEAKKMPPTEMFRKDERYSKFDEKVH